MSWSSVFLRFTCLSFISALTLSTMAANAPESSTEEAVVWVFFADKPSLTTEEVSQWAQTTFHPKALTRRATRRTLPGLFDERDWPVNNEYVKAIRGATTKVRTVSRWLNAVSAVVSRSQRTQIEALPFVRAVQDVSSIKRADIDRVISADIVPDDLIPPADFYGFSSIQLNQINLIELHNAGFTGNGVIIGILDTGFKLSHEAFNHPDHPLKVIAQYDFMNDDPIAEPEPGDAANQHDHGTYILGGLGAYLPDVLVGGAYDASYVLAKVEDVASEYFAEEDWFVAGLEFLEQNGADVATSSVVMYDNYTQDQLDGRTSVMTIGYNVAAENGMHCFQAAGNEGHDSDPTTSHLLAPADAFQVVTVGAIDINNNSAGFTSDGPTADGRVKPEILSRGVGAYTVNPRNDDGISTVSGTSIATPIAAAAAACITEARPNWTVGQLRTALTRSADYYQAHKTFDPLYIRGFGIMNALEAASSDVDCLRLDVDELIGGTMADIVVEGAQPGWRVAILWSTQRGSFSNSTGGWCVDFGLKLPGGNIASRTAGMGKSDGAGTFTKSILVPAGFRGRTVFLQAAQQNTCPESCMSNIEQRPIN